LGRKIHTFPASLENALSGKQKIKKKCSGSNTSKKWVFHISHFCYHNHQKVKKNQYFFMHPESLSSYDIKIFLKVLPPLEKRKKYSHFKFRS
jgi:hypothetical protein